MFNIMVSIGVGYSGKNVYGGIMKNKKVDVVQKENEPEVPVQVIAQSIRDIAFRWKQINKSDLKRDALVVLIKHSTGIPMVTINNVLNSLDGLERMYLK